MPDSTRPATPLLPSDPDRLPPPPPPPPMPTPRSIPHAGVSTLLLVATGAVLADVALHGRVASVAGSMTVVVTALTIVTSPRRRGASAVVPAALAILVSSNLVLRASDWVTGPTLAACAGLLLVATLDQLASTRLARLGTATILLIESALDAPRHLARPVVARISPPGRDRTAVLQGCLVAGLVVVVLTTLLANADAVVGQLLARGLETSIWSHLALTSVAAISISTLAVASDRTVNGPIARTTAPRPVQAAMGLGAVAVVLSVWVTIQATIALGGAERLLETAATTRADYAREGFFELVVVVVVVLSMQITFGRVLGLGRTRTAVVLNALVGGSSAVLVIITFSRLALYVEAYGLTMLRLGVAWFLGWLGFLVLVVSAWSAGLAAGRHWVNVATIVSAAVAVVAFGWSNPEATVAETNLSRDNATVELDTDYLRTLGPDASEILDSRGIRADVACKPAPFGPLGWNLGWSNACG